MHEVDMTRCLLLALEEWRQQHHTDRPRVETVHLDVGRFTCVEPDALLGTYAAAVAGSWLDGSRLTIHTIPLVGRCSCCRATYSPSAEEAYRSPCCDRPLEEIVSGRELRIRDVEYTLPSGESIAAPLAAAAAHRT
ncbi:hydrogenase maturation nickel metallochaperone HypA [Synechococcus sp. RSCCF101]|uniref:hydrogenase maturation nickel metallochaperone HypA/HybF n=1 Tax=Synechococcus sp. RSCCF101 TaxID=2511069 RepID=UPI0012466DB9|nr:hydrogenase maturation nickel metallochaperone HypA [Synechococcus sp. RSCCF101]QEY31911.1 hydrogenase maturation nickel metallochaperone HypA [Synechococcus sp. RSCCF101]